MANPTCEIPGCDGKYHARGWCIKHYRRWQAHGTTDEQPRPSTEQRFMEKISADGATGCWLWTACRDKVGYGRFNAEGQPMFAHRWAYEHFIGPIPEGMAACHRCDNPSCVNPAHLFPGTHVDNMRDAFEKGRITGQKLTPAQHVEIRRRYTGRRGQQIELAEEYGVSPWHISYILNRHKWKSYCHGGGAVPTAEQPVTS